MITTEASKRELRVDKINWLGSLRKIKNRNFRGNRSNVIDKFITLNNWNVRVICHSLFGIFFSALIVQKNQVGQVKICCFYNNYIEKILKRVAFGHQFSL